LPEELNHKNVIIEVKTNVSVTLRQYYSCDLKVQIEE
jgi:hypothetical protein